MTFEEWHYLVRISITCWSDARREGQTYFNMLDEYRPDLAEKIRCSIRDPFFNDSKIPEFLEFVKREW